MVSLMVSLMMSGLLPLVLRGKSLKKLEETAKGLYQNMEVSKKNFVRTYEWATSMMRTRYLQND